MSPEFQIRGQQLPHRKQWQIQDFPYGDSNLQGEGALTYYLANISGKERKFGPWKGNMEICKYVDQKGSAAMLMSLPGVASEETLSEVHNRISVTYKKH